MQRLKKAGFAVQLEHDFEEAEELSRGGVTVTDENGIVLAKHSSYQTSPTKKMMENNTAQLRYTVRMAIRDLSSQAGA